MAARMIGAGRKDRLDGAGLSLLLAIQVLLAANQIIVKLVNQGLQPVFFAGVRSVLAALVVWGWLVWRGRAPRGMRAQLAPGLLIGVVFAVEFLLLFLALDLTTVGRASVLMYSMPIWFAGLAHFGLGERVSGIRAAGLGLAFAGTAWAILSRGSAGEGTLIGDLCALGAAICWAGTAFLARRPALRAVGPEMQLFWMVLVSGPVLLLLAPFFGPLIRDLHPLHLVGLGFQATVVVAGGFIAWLWLLSVYPASTVASFSFLTPVMAVGLGWLFFDESLSISILGAVALVGAGIVLINRADGPPRPAAAAPGDSPH